MGKKIYNEICKALENYKQAEPTAENYNGYLYGIIKGLLIAELITVEDKYFLLDKFEKRGDGK